MSWEEAEASTSTFIQDALKVFNKNYVDENGSDEDEADDEPANTTASSHDSSDDDEHDDEDSDGYCSHLSAPCIHGLLLCLCVCLATVIVFPLGMFLGTIRYCVLASWVRLFTVPCAVLRAGVT